MKTLLVEIKTIDDSSWDEFEPYRELVFHLIQQAIDDWTDPIAANKQNNEDDPEVSHGEIMEFINSNDFALYCDCFDIDLSPEQVAMALYKKLEVMPLMGEIKQGPEIGKANPAKHIYLACEICGKGRWVELLHGKPRRRICRSCNGNGGMIKDGE